MMPHEWKWTAWSGLVFILLASIAVLPTDCAADTAATPTSAFSVTVSRRDGWCVAESPNFRCWTCLGAQPSRELALACESWRTRLCDTWGVQFSVDAWTPCCDIVVHPTQTAYNRALGRTGDSSVGSTRIRFDGERVVLRRVDLRSVAADWTLAALPHELSHVILAERFRGRPLPPWADEGIAMLSESSAKREARLADLRHALQHRPTYRIGDLLSVRQLPPAHLRDAFYGQSLALTSWLIERSSPQDFARFLDACHTSSIDDALRQEFGLSGIDVLEAEWRQWTQSPARMAIVDLWAPFDAKAAVASTDGD